MISLLLMFLINWVVYTMSENNDKWQLQFPRAQSGLLKVKYIWFTFPVKELTEKGSYECYIVTDYYYKYIIV